MISKVSGISTLGVAEDVHISRAPTELSDTDLTQCDALLQICDEAEVWLSPDGDVFATVSLNGHIEHYRIASS